MWRNSLSLTSRLSSSSSDSNKPKPSLLFLLFSLSQTNPTHGFFRRSTSTTAGPTAHAVDSDQTLINPLRPLGPLAVDWARHYGQCYWELCKAKLSMLVVATTGAGYVLGSGTAVDFAGLCYTCAGTMMVAASASTLNQVFEIKNDALMNRTKRRPLPSGRISVPHAVAWASSVDIAGTASLASKANMLVAGLGASNLILYAFVYTPLKQIPHFILPAALYFWQLPHFMALAYLCRDDYALQQEGLGCCLLEMLLVREQLIEVALRNCLYLLPLGYLAYDLGITYGWLCLESTLLALAISGTSLLFYMNRTRN